jgi:alkanesulfonate monooxygenase SsuD/methylene tetrahydromethanopterin reductase-like flavin-dependent oxidoreductase (luciferase family)
VFLAGYGGIRSVFDGYQTAYKKHHGTHAPIDRLAYCALVYVSDSDKAAQEGAEELIWYITANKVAEQWKNPPGYFPPQVAGQMMKTASKHAIQSVGAAGGIDQFGKTTPEEQVLKGNMMYGTPDKVYAQIKRFYDYTGGFGNLLIMGQAGFLSYENTVKSMRLFNDEVYPRLKELTGKWNYEEALATRDQIPVPKSNRDYEDFSVDFVRKVS